MINPNIFKAYDVRGLYPPGGQRGGRAADRPRLRRLSSAPSASPCRATCGCRRRPWPRPSSRARPQGADVVDYGMMGTDMLYFAVARDGHDGGAQITASHNPKDYNGIKLVRQEAFPLSGEAGISDIRDMIAAGKLPPPAATRGTVTTKNVVDDYVKHVLSFVDLSDPQAVQRRARRGQRHGRPGGAAALRAHPDQVADHAVLRGGRDVPEPRSQPAHRGEPPRHHRAGDRRQGRHRHRLGRRRRSRASSSTAPASSSPATSSRRCWPKRSCSRAPARRSSTTSAPATRSRTRPPSTAARR